MNYSDAIRKYDKFRIRYNTDESFEDFLDFELDDDEKLIESLLEQHEICIAKQELRDNAIVDNIAKLDVKSYLTEQIYKSIIVDDDTIKIEKSSKIDDMILQISDYAKSQLDLVARLESKQSDIFSFDSDELKKYSTATNIKVRSSAISHKVTLNTHFLRDLTHSADECIDKHHDIKHTLKKLLQLNMLSKDALKMLADANLLKDKSAITFAKLSKLDNLTEFLSLLCDSLNNFSYELASRNCFDQVIILDEISYKV